MASRFSSVSRGQHLDDIAIESAAVMHEAHITHFTALVRPEV